MASRARRRARASIVVAVLSATGIAGALALRAPDPVSADDVAAAAEDGAVEGDGTSLPTANVERRDLVERTSVSGTLGYGQAPAVRGHRSGILTSTSQPGTILERGNPAYTIDGRPIPLLYGKIPMWRRLDVGVEGIDVVQFEENLVALGYATEAQLKGDGKYDARTAAAVKKWQKDLGVEQTGFVDHGDFEYVEGPVRVADNALAVGDQVGPGGNVLVVTETTREVTIELEAARQSLATEGATVTVQLPDGTSVPGKVTEVGRVAQSEDTGIPGDSGTPKITVIVTLDDPNAGGTLDSAPVTVQLTKSTAQAVLAVPVRALLALAEGGYAVEIVHAGGHSLVGVELGSFADGWVAVEGQLREGDEVVVAP
jgi:peptidoglycan hydrolase-like protein with peptidoglycan-binding domain